MKDIICSLVVIKNNEEIYKKFYKSLKKQQEVEYELICIENSNNELTSAREAYNSVIDKVKGKYVIFLHQDIIFFTSSDLKDIIENVEKINRFGVVGIAGTPKELENRKRIIYSNIVHGLEQKKIGVTIMEPKKVQTVDECLFIIKKEELLKIRFSNKEGWHLYAAEQCLRMQRELNLENYVIPIRLWHLSDGKSLNCDYIHQINDLISEYKDYTSVINTTVKKWKTRGWNSKIYRKYYYLKQKIKGMIKK